MNLKRWFLWFCLAVIVVSEVMLFHANQEASVAMAARDKYQHEAEQAQNELDQMKASAAAAQGAAGDRLRQENQRLTRALARLKDETNRLQQANQQLTQQLAALGSTAQQQQSQLEQWEAAGQQASTVFQAAQSQAATNRLVCIANLKLIEAAKLEWALVNNKDETAVPTREDLLPYFKNGVFPVCPSGGVYTINAIGEPPTCSIPGHALPQ